MTEPVSPPAGVMAIGRSPEEHTGRLIEGSGLVARFLRRFVRWHYFSFIEEYVPAGSAVLEFGSGGGDRWLSRHYRMTTAELAFGSASASRALYGRAVNANVAQLPLRASSFDATVSSFVFEHLSVSVAQDGLRELHRVLRPGGVLVCLCDLECDHPLLAWVRRTSPEGYRDAFIDAPGHFGLRRESEWSALLRDAGFVIDRWELMTRSPFLDHGPLCNLAASNALPPWIRFAGWVAYRLSRVPRVAAVWSLAVIATDDAVRWLLPSRWAYRLLLVARRAVVEPDGGRT